MKKLSLIGLLLILGAILAVTGCGGATTSTNPTSATTSTTTATALEPVAAVSVIGPIPPYTPGGPNIEITLKNVSTEPIVSLTAILGIVRAGPSVPFTYSFNVTSAAPLQAGKTVSARQILIGGGFDSEVSYPLSINGTLQSGKAFSYTKQVKITAPAQ
jgi:hypothetical protein